MMRYAILISFSVFLVGPVLGVTMSMAGLSFLYGSQAERLFLLSLAAFPTMLIACALGAQKHPELVRGVLFSVGFVLLLLVPFLVVPRGIS
jgi:hypothetical protein